MTLQNRIEAFAFLGSILREGLNNIGIEENSPLYPEISFQRDSKPKSIETMPGSYTSLIQSLINTQAEVNPWFTPGNVKMALNSIAKELTVENLVKWTSAYPQLNDESKKKTIGVIMAGNIPLVGFHDLLSVIISGNRIIAKTSSKDSDLLRSISGILCDKNPEFENDIVFTTEKLSAFDAIIATGSGNSSRYFDYYFGKYPNIIRKNRNSVAIIDGKETDNELEELGKDIFSYFGLGCRNISKLYVPANYDFDKMIKSWHIFENIVHHNKYANNYDHNKAIFLINRENFLDTGFVLLNKLSSLSSPIGVLNYENYEEIGFVTEQIDSMRERIQCVVGHNQTPFGEAQAPALWNYADGIDTIDFLNKLKN